MLNSQKLKEVCEVLNRENITFCEAHAKIKGDLDINTRKDALRQKEVRLGSNNNLRKIDIVFGGTGTTDFDISLIELEMHLCFFESKIAEIAEPKLTGEMVLIARFKVDGDVKDIDKKLKDMGYVKCINVEYINTILSYKIYDEQNYIIAISLIENNIILSVKKVLDKRKDFGEYFLDLKMCMTSLYNQISKR